MTCTTDANDSRPFIADLLDSGMIAKTTETGLNLSLNWRSEGVDHQRALYVATGAQEWPEMNGALFAVASSWTSPGPGSIASASVRITGRKVRFGYEGGEGSYEALTVQVSLNGQEEFKAEVRDWGCSGDVFYLVGSAWLKAF